VPIELDRARNIFYRLPIVKKNFQGFPGFHGGQLDLGLGEINRALYPAKILEYISSLFRLFLFAGGTAIYGDEGRDIRR
jgi:hypothetical protein